MSITKRRLLSEAVLRLAAIALAFPAVTLVTSRTPAGIIFPAPRLFN
ncbi:MAG: hypothetical protein ACLVHV_13790 [Oscillospiraceae bacterium]